MYLLAKTQMPKEEEIDIFCTKCLKCIDEGYYCRERELILCNNCQEKHHMERCPHKDGIHMHIKFPGIRNRNEHYMEEIAELSKKQREKKK